MTTDEKNYLAAAYADPEQIDKAVSAGLTPDHFPTYSCRAQWELVLQLRGAGKPCDTAAVYAAAVESGRLNECGGAAGISDCSDANAVLNGPAYLSVLLSAYSRREAWKLLSKARDMVQADSCDMEEVGRLAEAVVSVSAGKQVLHRPVAVIAQEARADAEAAIAGTADTGTVVLTGLDKFDRYATPIRSDEYVVVAGRSSHGKSSLMLQIAGHNLARGLRVAIFSLETSDKAVIKQLAGQRAAIDLRDIANATNECQRKYMDGLRWLEASKNLLVFDREMTLEAINARCRIIAQSFKPHLTCIDQLSLIGGVTGTSYERMSALSKAMIPLQKVLGGTLMALAQLNQGAEKEEREPTRTDFRDSGQVLEDGHRCIVAWRKPGQFLDQQSYDYDILQLKLRNGPLARVKCRFHAPTTRFMEDAA